MTTRPRDDDPMIEWALWYASGGWSIMPLHEPLFNDAGALTGCTCEAYKRSEKYHQWLISKGMGHRFDPAFKCETPAKHPRFSDWETKATNDKDQIRRWWSRWPSANIGLAVGKSGLLTLDLDAYKDGFAGAGLLTRADEETITQLSGGGGQHLVYRLPEGKDWGNATGDLPEGIDVRGVGGMQVIAPSRHPSGRRYAWENDYGPGEIPISPVPDWLGSILDDAQERGRAAVAVRFAHVGIDTDRPDLSAWNLAEATVDAIHHPPAKGGRSEHDMRVITAICYAGLDDDQIRAIFQHYPIGAAGKYAENGDRYLARTIGKARGYVADHPGPVQVRAEIPQIRAWVKSCSFADYVPKELQSVKGYRTDSTDTKVADALLDVVEDRGTFTPIIGLRNLAQRAGVGSAQTVANALKRLENWFLTVCPDGRLDLSPARRLDTLPHSLTKGRVSNLRAGEREAYSEHKADDPFLTGVSRTIKKRVKAQAARVQGLLAEDGQGIGVSATYKELLGAVEPGLGETILRVIDGLITHGDMHRAEMVELLGKTSSAIGRATLRAERLGLLSAEVEDRAKVYSLAADWEDRIESMRPHLKTYMLGPERAKRDCEQLIAYCDRAMKQAEEEERRKLARRKAKAEGRLHGLLCILYGLDADQVATWIRTPSATNAAFDYSPILKNAQSERAVVDMQTVSDLSVPGRVLWGSESAQLRQAAGRLGLVAADYVESRPLSYAADD